jgi:uncharacterized protein (TIGR03066 family)
MRMLPMLALCLGVSASFAAPIPKEAKSANAEKIVGVWKMTKAHFDLPPGLEMTMEFTKEGQLSINVKQNGFPVAFPKGELPTGTYTVDGEKLSITIKQSDKNNTENTKIKNLDDEVLEIVGSDEKTTTFARVKEKKAEK